MQDPNAQYPTVSLQSMPVPLSIPVVYPRLLTLHDMEDGCGDLIEMETSSTGASGNGGGAANGEQKSTRLLCKLPKYKWPSVDHVTDESILLLDAGTDVYLWLGVSVSSEVTEALFDVSELSSDGAVSQSFVCRGVFVF